MKNLQGVTTPGLSRPGVSSAVRAHACAPCYFSLFGNGNVGKRTECLIFRWMTVMGCLDSWRCRGMRALASFSLPVRQRPQRDPLTFHPVHWYYRHVVVASSWGILRRKICQRCKILGQLWGMRFFPNLCFIFLIYFCVRVCVRLMKLDIQMWALNLKNWGNWFLKENNKQELLWSFKCLERL